MSNKKGFSLVELMVVITIMSILMMAGISSFSFYYKTFAETRLINIQKLLDFSIVNARISDETVIVCAATVDSFDSDGKLDENTFTCSNSTDWGDNPIVSFKSQDGTQYFNPLEDEMVANLAKGNHEHIYLSLSGNPAYFKISPDGFMATGNGNMVYCDKDNKYQAALITNMVGRVIYTDSPTKDNGDAYVCSV